MVTGIVAIILVLGLVFWCVQIWLNWVDEPYRLARDRQIEDLEIAERKRREQR